MFLAACSKSWLSCAKGHTHRLTVSTAATCHYSCHDKANANLPLKNTTQLRWLQRLKTRCWSSSPLSCRPDLDLHREVDQRSEHLFSVICRSKVSKHHCRLHLPLSSVYGANGFCTEASRKPVLEKKSSEKGEDQAASSPAANEGHFQFKELYENPWTIPNYLCMARIVLSPVLGYLVMEQYFHVSLGLFALAGATDLLDGYIARNWPNQKSALGSALDPLADKILISILYVSLTYAQLIPAPLTALIISRDVALIAAVFYVRYKTVPPPVTLRKFFNPCYTTARLKPTLISKINTGVQLFLVAASLAAPVFHYTDSVLLQSLWFITALTTAASGYSYYHYGKKTVEVLNNTK
ncbi:cardiolipin synthase (CMP-forming)-like isoform X1 [Sinocyclocheilus rhinocerous]|uniref:Cardiolipin synthase (CMP-forming) n=1 Tax=Sinocyclocheilus rhinocerous TaxID=307959 RepID=A0A673GG81_9TELE|nr:PREDICTED: cardiolipin synthase (CMP-forming)-like isoform X1 [Sinocyclocheilus rhinocerous]